MTREELVNIIQDNYPTLVFNFNNKKCGIDIEVDNSIPKFQSWFGEKIKFYDDINAMLDDDFFDGKSLSKLVENGIEIDFI